MELRKEKETPAATTFSISTNEFSYTYYYTVISYFLKWNKITESVESGWGLKKLCNNTNICTIKKVNFIGSLYPHVGSYSYHQRTREGRFMFSYKN